MARLKELEDENRRLKKMYAEERLKAEIQDNLVVVIKYKIVTTPKGEKSTKTKEEVGRYDHLYESSAGHGGTIFWKFNPEYLKLEGAKEYK